MEPGKTRRWKRVLGEVAIFVIAQVLGGLLADRIVPVNWSAMGTATGEELTRLDHQMTIHYWVWTGIWVGLYLLMRWAWKRRSRGRFG